ncbi:MAG TPA: glycogen debranching protein GlgX [Acidimicrobiales bacterium]|nr:glycogen debranching protein GlgX [Acidimicrobiales bacterium]
MATQDLKITGGRAQPLGATVDSDGAGVNFSVYSEYATSVELLLFADHDAAQPDHVIVLEPGMNKSFHFWHVHVAGVGAGQLYAYRMDGPTNTSQSGCRFNRNKVLIDPYALGNVNHLWDRGSAVGPGDNVATSMRSVVLDPDDYDWEDDRFPNTSMADSVIYEMHVRGFTQGPSSGVAHPGTFKGVVEKIPYLVGLGVTAVELLPIFDFDESQVLRTAPDGTPLRNYWGYDPYGHFAPQSSYCTEPGEGSHIREFRDMVKALHAAGIEVILDVVYNHTSEGNQNGPTISFRGQANEAYYHLVPGDKQYYMDYSGCGNTFNANHPVVTKYIIESLEYWVSECHVDGFRFDLGSVLSRGPDGAPMTVPPVLWNIELSRILSETKVIAEAWDAGGLYQVGRFPGKRWCEWNGPYRDDIRRFLRGEPGIISAVATRLAGSEDLFRPEEEVPSNSVNFITCHDGFTLNDLVSYNGKHNEANGENNRDGSDDNRSWNCGSEGEAQDPEVETLRARQVRNALVMLLLSRGTPMLLGGDEFRRTQHGNNNAYCQDSELSWFDWNLVTRNDDLVRFVSELIAFRKRHRTLRRDAFYTGEANARGIPEISWHGCRLNEAGWNDPLCRVLAFTLGGAGDDPDLHVILNMYDLGLDFEIPQIPGQQWSLAVDTAKPSPEDIVDPDVRIPVDGPTHHVFGRSAVVLVSHPGGTVAS